MPALNYNSIKGLEFDTSHEYRVWLHNHESGAPSQDYIELFTDNIDTPTGFVEISEDDSGIEMSANAKLSLGEITCSVYSHLAFNQAGEPKGHSMVNYIYAVEDWVNAWSNRQYRIEDAFVSGKLGSFGVFDTREWRYLTVARRNKGTSTWRCYVYKVHISTPARFKGNSSPEIAKLDLSFKIIDAHQPYDIASSALDEDPPRSTTSINYKQPSSSDSRNA